MNAGERKPVVRDDLLLKDEVYAIVGAAMAVHNELKSGFAESVYQEAMEIEFRLRGIPFERKKRLRITYKGHALESEFEADLVCYGSVIVELKAQRKIQGYEEAQVINFGDPVRLDWHRYIV